jgi:hypothetical protein
MLRAPTTARCPDLAPIAALACAALWSACAGAGAAIAPLPPRAIVGSDDATIAKLRAAIAAPHRPDAHRARDPQRHPFETLTFFGLRDDQTVVELWPGGGWYTEILAPVLHDRGQLVTVRWARIIQAPGVRPRFPRISPSAPTSTAACSP